MIELSDDGVRFVTVPKTILDKIDALLDEVVARDPWMEEHKIELGLDLVQFFELNGYVPGLEDVKIAKTKEEDK